MLAAPSSFSVPIPQMVAAMRETFMAIDIDLVVLSEQTLNLPLLIDLDVGKCLMGTVTEEQRELFTHRDNADERDIVVYFIRQTNPPLAGCAAHPNGRPGAVVANMATPWTLAHEIGHVLGLDHVPTRNPLMVASTSQITVSPPDLSAEEREDMYDSDLTHEE